MHGFVLQDFTTIRGATSVSTITQGENGWLDVSAYQDLFAWIDVREVTLSSANNIQFNLQTAPIKDEFLFTNLQATPLQVTGALTAPSIIQVIYSAGSTPNKVALGAWLRWQLVLNGTPSAAWDITFRIAVTCNHVGGSPQRSSGGMAAGMVPRIG